MPATASTDNCTPISSAQKGSASIMQARAMHRPSSKVTGRDRHCSSTQTKSIHALRTNEGGALLSHRHKAARGRLIVATSNLRGAIINTKG